MGADDCYSCIAFYNSSNAMGYAFNHWKNKSKYRHPFLSMRLNNADTSDPTHQAVPIRKVGPKDQHCLVFEVKKGVSSGCFRKPKNLLSFFIVPGSSHATTEEMIRLGVDEMLSRRIPEDEFFFGYHSAPQRFTSWPYAMRPVQDNLSVG